MDEINLVTITFHEGTLVVNGLSQDLTQSLPFLLPDPITKNFRWGVRGAVGARPGNS